MSFANPFLLLGLLGAAVPILIHLINRRRPRRQPFPAMELLQRSVKRVERRWRIRRFLLLSLRVLLLACLALAAAGPLLGEDRTRAQLSVQGPERIALVIDASLSMRATYDGRSAFSLALDRARERVDRLGPEDRAVIVTTGNPPRVWMEQPTADRGRLFGVLSDIEPGWRPAPLAEAVSVAAQALGRSKTDGDAPTPPADGPKGRVLVLSDLAGPALSGAAALDVPGRETPATLEIVDVLEPRAPSERDNYGVVNVGSEPVPGEAPRTVEVTARIQSHAATREEGSPEPREIALRCANQDVATGVVELELGALTQKTLRNAFETDGAQECFLQLEPDRLVEDDVRFLSVKVRKRVRTLIVDGDPSGIAKEDEVFYLVRALEAGAADQPPPVVISDDELSRTDFEPFEVIVLAGVSAPTPEDGERLTQFVQSGGGLWVTTAEGMNTQAYQQGLGRVLPRPLRGLKRGDGEETFGFEEPDLEHPVLGLFSGAALGGLLTTRSIAFMLLEPGGDRRIQTLLSFEGGAPALVTAATGQGRVALLTTSVDRDLSDLPIRPAFVPLVRQLVLWLGDALSEPERRETLVGQARDITVPDGAERLEVTGPDGRSQYFGVSELDSGTLRFTGTSLPGLYQVVAVYPGGESQTLERASFAVNIDPVESDLRPVSVDQAEAILRGEASPLDARVGNQAEVSQSNVHWNSQNLVGLLLALMGLAFVFESGLTAVRTGR